MSATAMRIWLPFFHFDFWYDELGNVQKSPSSLALRLGDYSWLSSLRIISDIWMQGDITKKVDVVFGAHPLNALIGPEYVCVFFAVRASE